jgi:hypothetical protein
MSYSISLNKLYLVYNKIALLRIFQSIFNQFIEIAEPNYRVSIKYNKDLSIIKWQSCKRTVKSHTKLPQFLNTSLYYYPFLKQ